MALKLMFTWWVFLRFISTLLCTLVFVLYLQSTRTNAVYDKNLVGDSGITLKLITLKGKKRGQDRLFTIMRYLCLNQAGPRAQHQGGVIAESENKSKRTIEETIDNISNDGLVPMKKVKRFRSAFTTEQIKYLDTEFRKYPYIGSARRKEVSSALNIPERAVKIWFQNRRMKEKKDVTTNDTDSDEHKNSRKVDVANDQLNNECTVTSTNNRHYASLPLISPKNEIPPSKNEDAVKKENEFAMKVEIRQRENGTRQASVEFPVNIYKPYLEQPELGHRNSVLESGASIPAMQSPQSEVSSTSPHERLPQDLSRKRTAQIKPTRPLNPPGYFPLNLKKYYAQPSPSGTMLWKPIQVLPIVSTGASAVSISNSHAGSLTVSPVPAQAAKECHCDCRCHPPPPSPVLLQQAAPSPLPQYVLTALPLQNRYYKY